MERSLWGHDPSAHSSSERQHIAAAISRPPPDAAIADRGNPWRFHRSAKWAKAMDGFAHVKSELEVAGDRYLGLFHAFVVP